MRQPREADAAFCANVKRLREAQRLALRDVAERAGLGHTIVYRIEGGQPPLLGHAVAIAAALGVTLADMLGGDLCGTCFNRPPAGFICSECGRGPEVQDSSEGDRE
ncbi:MAG TPA: helix-turn-helix transcriptional regulator [Streptosporangiaceae bacterium]|nr:helix-turn-helix transcriptional regulator [Streptosporangiaceae bacterium]